MTETTTTAKAYWPLKLFSLYKGSLKAKASTHAVFAIPERAEIKTALYDHRSAYTLDEIDGFCAIVFTSGDECCLDWCDDDEFPAIDVLNAKRAERALERVEAMELRLRRLEPAVVALARDVAPWLPRASASTAREMVALRISRGGADVVREAMMKAYGYWSPADVADLCRLDRDLLVLAVLETARRLP